MSPDTRRIGTDRPVWSALRAAKHKKLSVLVADEHPAYADALRSFLQIDLLIRIVASVGSERDLLLRAARLRPRVAVIEADGVHLRGMELIPKLSQAAPGGAIILMATDYKRSEQARALAAGALAYVAKEYAGLHLLDLVWGLMAGGLPRPLSTNPGDGHRQLPDGTMLGTFEAAALQLLTDQQETKRIAAALGLPQPSTETCLRRLMVKLRLNDLDELQTYARTNGHYLR